MPGALIHDKDMKWTGTDHISAVIVVVKPLRIAVYRRISIIVLLKVVTKYLIGYNFRHFIKEVTKIVTDGKIKLDH